MRGSCSATWGSTPASATRAVRRSRPSFRRRARSAGSTASRWSRSPRIRTPSSRSSTRPTPRRRGSRRTSSRTADPCSTRRPTSSSSTRATRRDSRPSTTTTPTSSSRPISKGPRRTARRSPTPTTRSSAPSTVDTPATPVVTGEGGGSGAASRLGRFGGLVPAALYFGLFFFVPFGLIVCFSFWEDVNYTIVHHWTLDNYHYFLSQPEYRRTMWATLWMSVAATAITLLIAFPFSYWLSRYVARGLQKPLLVLVIVPFWTSYLLRMYSWLNILGTKGLINTLLEK